MRLSATIIYDNLPPSLKARLIGLPDDGNPIGRPEFHEGSDHAFLAGHLYIVRAERLPARARTERGTVILCIGSSPRLRHYQSRCCVIMVHEDADFFATFNVVQHVFDAYDAWEDDLNGIIDDDASISRMLDRSEAVLGNALYAIDSDFRILGSSRLAGELPAGASFESSDGLNLSLGSIDEFLGDRDLAIEEREPLLIEIRDNVTLNCNLYEGEVYRGCVTVQYGERRYRESDRPVLKFLAAMLLKAMRQLASSVPDGRGTMRQAVQDLVGGIPLDAMGRSSFERAASSRRFVCMRLKLSNRLANLPIGYVRNMVESGFPKSLTFEHHGNSIVSFIDLDELDASAPPLEAIKRVIQPFTGTMGMKAGISDPVEDIMQARLYYLEANAALENGMLFEPDGCVFEFQDHILEDMVVSSMGEFPLELLCPAGLRALMAHDAGSATSYVETLRCYLENNMSVTATARELFVHRSTLLERLARIRRELALDLDDADVRLRLGLLLKAMQVHEQLQANTE